MIRFHKLMTPAVLVAVAFLVACQPAPTPGARALPASGLAPVNDIGMYYEIHGDGTPLILLHGGLGNTLNWGNQIPALSKQYKVITVDSRGHGR